MKEDCYGSSPGSNSDISQKYKMGDLSKEVANTLYPAKNNIKNTKQKYKICS
jgi:hypothetical protein